MQYDAVVIGGGFYGVSIASYLATARQMPRVLLIECESELLTRASYNNQARIHNGYHYPRSFTTAFRSRVNLPRFMRDYPAAIQTNFTKLYAIARRNSKVTSRQFVRFCRDIGAHIEPAPDSLTQLFEPRLIEALFLVEEYAFNAQALKTAAQRDLLTAGVALQLQTRVKNLRRSGNTLRVQCARNADKAAEFSARYVFNCTYSGLNQFSGDFPGTTTGLKHELAEMALIRMPAGLQSLGITVMDGPFFSTMPFPARGLHTLSHVRYTPHLNWPDQAGEETYRKLADYHRESRVERMMRDVSRYIPAMQHAKYVESLFEIKTVLVKNESDDGRPILFEHHAELPNCYSILGGKIDNIYDVLKKLDSEPLTA
ncbi:MAG TPA: FAD-dependent oxidoreductase [Gallionella sp.]|nr:FAD-dependent oxidoreductase [Gallionella sp.]